MGEKIEIKLISFESFYYSFENRFEVIFVENWIKIESNCMKIQSGWIEEEKCIQHPTSIRTKPQQSPSILYNPKVPLKESKSMNTISFPFIAHNNINCINYHFIIINSN